MRTRHGAKSLAAWSTYRLAERTALANRHLVTFLNTEAWGDVGSEVLVSLLVPGVLLDVVEIFPADDESSVHLRRDNGSSEDSAADRDQASEGALLV